MAQKMKFLALAILAIIPGCAYYGSYGPGARPTQTSFMVVNNSGHLIDLVQDGRVVIERLATGKVQAIRMPLLSRQSTVVALGYTEDGAYAGTDQWTFFGTVPQTWTIGYLYPRGSAPTQHF